MPIPTEPIGSMPRPIELIEGVGSFSAGSVSRHQRDALSIILREENGEASNLVGD